MPRRKRLTYRRADRALLAVVDLIECSDVTASEKQDLNQAADMIRELRDRAER